MKEVLQQAIDFAEYCLEELDLSYMASNQAKRLIEKSRQAIAEAEKQEPVALMVINGEISYKSIDDDQSFGMWCPVNYDSRHSFPNDTRFYIHPQPARPKREPLTEREILDFWLARFDVEGSPINNFARAIEAAHGIIKNYPEKDKN